MSSTPQVTVHERPQPVLLGERIGRVREALAGGAVPVALLLGLGVVFLVAGLTPTTTSFVDRGESYDATCGIETVLVGSTWEPLDAACGQGGGLRTLAVAGGAALLVAGLAHLAWVAARAGAREPGPLRRALRRRSGQVAAGGALAGGAVAAAATLVLRSRLDVAALTGDCLPGSGSCADHSGWAGVVQVGGGLLALGCVGVLLHLTAMPRTSSARIGSVLLVVGVVLVLLGARPVAVEAGSGAGRLRATCGIEVLLAGHPQPSVTSACRGAMGSRVAAAAGGAALAAVGGVLLHRARRHDGSSDAGSVSNPPTPRRRRREPLRAGAEAQR